VEEYTTEDGLPQSSILSMVQTADGYLWMGTYEGIARFDGIRFTVFDTTNTPEMKSNRIRVLLEDNSGGLWIGTSGGLLHYRNGAFRNFTVNDGLPDDYIVSLCEDDSGRICIGTTHGFAGYEAGQFSAYTGFKEISGAYVSALVKDAEGALYIGIRGGGLYRMKDGTITRTEINGLPPDVDIRVLLRDKAGQIWVGTGGNGVAVIGDKGNKGNKGNKGDKGDKETRLFTLKDGLAGSDIRALFQDSHGTVWIGTNGQGLNAFRNNTFSTLSSEQGFFSSPIRTILEDREGSLWIGTRDGLSQLKEGKFTLYNTRSGLPVDNVRTVFQGSDGRIWLGTVSGGLVRYKDGRFTAFGLEQGLKSEHIWTLAQGGDGSLWIGTYGGGLHRMKGDRIVTVYNTSSGLSNNVVRAVYVDQTGKVWVGTNGGGVDVLDPETGTFTNYSRKNGLSGNFVYAISGSSSGTVWIGTYSGSLNRFKAGIFSIYGEKEGLKGYAIWSIYPEPGDDGSVWLGTDGGGLVRLKNGTFKYFTARDGMYSNLAFTVLEDKRGNLWMNCNKGIYSVKKSDLEAYMEGKILKIPYISFGKSQGIKSTECAGPAQPAGLCTSDGTLWFPTIRGAVVIDPEHIKINTVKPPVVIEEVRVNSQLISSYPHEHYTDSPLILKPGRKRLEFKFTGLSYITPGQVKFKCQLVGYDDLWIEHGSRRTVSYTNIEPGDYTFRVKACNNDGVWNETSANFYFTLNAFFWQTWWFQALVVIAFAFISYLVIGFVKKHMKLIAFWKTKKYISSYEIDEQIGVGGMGVVYKVHSLIDKTRTYAMKVMKEEHLQDELQKKRFKIESQLVDRIDHPNIVKVHERGEDNGNLYIVMELLQGRTLAERYKLRQYPTVSQCIHIMSQVAHILVKLHHDGIIHRDLKPENIMLIQHDGDPDFVKLLDFGIAKEQHVPRMTETGKVMGTIAYLPPEVVHRGKFTVAVDIYSLGIIGYEMLTLKQPFVRDKIMETMKDIITRVPKEPKVLNSQVPDRLNQLIMEMIAKDIVDRPDARAVLTVLASIS
jgi:ligand-binding sensor domain-containing protein/tRNA A-37 threonylcarbamoyl transferase component Bud32